MASVLNGASLETPIEEQLTDNPDTSIPIGYSQSKWVTEQVCGKAASTVLRDRVQILRIGQLCGDIERGTWNESEGWPLMLRTASTTGKLPLLNEVRRRRHVIAGCLADFAPHSRTHRGYQSTLRHQPCKQKFATIREFELIVIVVSPRMEIALNAPNALVAHVANPQPTAWQDIIDGLAHAGVGFEPIVASQWVVAVDDSKGDDVTNPSKKMLSMWKAAVSIGPNLTSYTTAVLISHLVFPQYGDSDKGNKPAAPVSIKNATTASPSLAACGPVSQELIGKMVARWRESGFMTK